MTMEFVMQVSAEALMVTAKVAGPILGAALVAGLIVAIFQAVTQIQEMTLTFIPKIIVSVAVAAMFYEFMMRSIIDFTVRIITSIPSLVQ